MTKAIWISYDLGIKGDYPQLYAWLDDRDAKEAGNSVAFLNYEFQGKSDSDFKKALKNDLESNIDFKPGDRIYVIRGRVVEGKTKFSGTFILGKRKSSPWEGYGQNNDEITDEDV